MVMMGKTSVLWLCRMVEDLRGVEIKDFYQSICYGNTIYVARRRSNGHGRYLKLSEYGGGGRKSSIVIPEGNKGRGWAECVA